ncbi:hypothetical protein DP20_3698 [Shigella flexneri]|nr:hypothetical protein DP20_3698 [Shigella flexneri]
MHRLFYLPVSQFDFPAITVQIRHFSSGEAHGVRHRRQQMADFSLRVTVSRRAVTSFPSPGHFFRACGLVFSFTR